MDPLLRQESHITTETYHDLTLGWTGPTKPVIIRIGMGEQESMYRAFLTFFLSSTLVVGLNFLGGVVLAVSLILLKAATGG